MRKLLLTLLLISSFVSSYSQMSGGILERIPITSPNISSLGRYVDVPVNYHTGIPQISYPIYEINEGPINIPVSLSYHAGGLRVNETASWVGTGWTLNAGGMVTRSVHGLHDEKSELGHSYLDDGGYESYFYSSAEDRFLYQEVGNGHLDGEPDLFFYNFGQYSGKFFFRPDGTPVSIPKNDIEIEVILCQSGMSCNSGYERILGWKIITPDGNKYYFGKDVNTSGTQAVEYTIPYTNTNGSQGKVAIGSWLLYKVESADSEFRVDFSYSAEEYAYYTMSIGGVGVNSFGGLGNNLVKNTVEGVRLRDITWGNGSVDFEVSNNTIDLRKDLTGSGSGFTDFSQSEAYPLKQIAISSFDQQYCKTYNFEYGYFYDGSTSQPYPIQSPTISSDRYRLKLESIQEKSCDATTSIPATTFSYYDENNVPRVLTYALDHWGFYNGKTSNDALMPPVSTNGGQSYSPGVDREASWPEMRAGALKEITYPTGGSTEYIYGYDEVKKTEIEIETTYTHEETVHCYVVGMDHLGQDCDDAYSISVATQRPYRFLTYGLGTTGSFTLKNGSTTIATFTASMGQSLQYDLSLTPGTYTVDATTNNGTEFGQNISLSIEEGTINSTPVDEFHPIGGLRIDEIKFKDSDGTEEFSKKYEYDESVVLFGIPKYISRLKNEHNRIMAQAQHDSYSLEGCKLWNSSFYNVVGPASTVPMQSTQGAHKGYEFVKEYQTGNGYNLYQYDVSGAESFPLEVVSQRSITGACTGVDYPTLPLPHDFKRGKLIKHQVYDENNNLLKESTNTLQYEEDVYGAGGVKVYQYSLIQGGTNLEYSHYELKSGRITSQKTVEKLFTPGTNDYQAKSSITTFGSDEHTQVTSQQLFDNETATGVALTETVMKYVKDLTACNTTCATCYDDLAADLSLAYSTYQANSNFVCSNGGSACSSFKGCDMGVDPCQTEIYDQNGNSYGINYCKKCSYTNYKYDILEAVNDFRSCLSTTCTVSINNSCLQSELSGASDELKSLLQLELKNQNSTVEVTNYRNGEVTMSVYSRYNESLDGDNTKVYPTEAYKLETVNPITSGFSGAYLNNGNIVIDNRYSNEPESSVKYSLGRMVELTGKDGVTVSYIWSNDNMYPIVEAVGVDYQTLSTTFNSVSEDFNALRNHANMEDVLISTYDYLPLAGISEETNAQGISLNYVYDKLGRLYQVKDQDNNVLKQYEYNYQSSTN